MVDLGVALTWIALSAVSAKGLTALAHAAATSDAEAEVASIRGDGRSEYDGAPFDLLRDRG